MYRGARSNVIRLSNDLLETPKDYLRQICKNSWFYLFIYFFTNTRCDFIVIWFKNKLQIIFILSSKMYFLQNVLHCFKIIIVHYYYLAFYADCSHIFTKLFRYLPTYVLYGFNLKKLFSIFV